LLDRLEQDDALYREAWNIKNASTAEPWWIYVILGFIADSPEPVSEEAEMQLRQQLHQTSSVDNIDYLFCFIEITIDLGMVLPQDGGLVIASPVLKAVLRERNLYPQARDWCQANIGYSMLNVC
jgi:hypothetical protein